MASVATIRCLLLLSLLMVTFPKAAVASGGATDINFDGTYLSGYSATWRDWYDPWYLSQYDPLCECYLDGYTSVTVIAQLYRPGGTLHAAAIANHGSHARLNLNPSVPAYYGNWTSTGSHYGEIAWYDPSGYYCGFAGCFFWNQTVYLGGTADQAVVPDPTQRTARLKMRAFIAPEWIWSPVISQNIFRGDDRGFCENCGSARAELFATYRSPQLGNPIVENPLSGAWLTEEYNADTSVDWGSGRLTEEAKNDWQVGFPMKLNWAVSDLNAVYCDFPEHTGGNTLWVGCRGAASNPLINFAPAIDWDYYIRLTWQSGYIAYNFEFGCHDAYPSHELYINGQAIVNDSDNGNPLSLIEACGVEVYRDGWVQ